jgi:HAD superfamily hydrolase (TIGR01484 family)
MYSNIKVVAMDLDGTITNHKTKPTTENVQTLKELAKRYKLIMVGAGQVQRIFNQLEKFPIDVIGNYGMQYGEYNSKTGEIDIVKDYTVGCDKDSVTARVNMLREKYGFTDYKGETVEFHPSGCVTFPILGTKAEQADKLAFDPDRKKRRAIYDDVCKVFSDYTVFVGGSSSFDMAPSPYDKKYALEIYCKEKGYTMNQIAYVGDDYGQGGNDESVYKSDAVYFKIDDFRDFPKVVEPLLKYSLNKF